MRRRVATHDELERAVRRYGPEGARAALRRYRLIPPIEGGSIGASVLGATSGLSATFTIPAGGVAAGSVLVLCVIDGLGSTASYSATDSRSNPYTAATSAMENGVDIAMPYGSITTPLQAGDTVTFKKGGSTAGVLACLVVCTGVSATADGVASGLQSGGVGNNTWNTGAGITTSNPSDLLLVAGVYSHNANLGAGGPPETPVSGYADITPTNFYFSGWPAGGFVAYQVVSSTGTYAPTGTYTTSVNGNAAQILALEGSGGGAAPGPNPPMINWPQAMWRSAYR